MREMGKYIRLYKDRDIKWTNYGKRKDSLFEYFILYLFSFHKYSNRLSEEQTIHEAID